MNKAIRLLILLFVFTSSLGSGLYAQHLSEELQLLITEAKAKNSSIKINHLNMEQASIETKTARNTLLPKIYLSGSYTRLNDDIVFDDDTQNLLVGTQKLLIKEAIGVPFNAPFPAGIPLTDIPPLQKKNILKSAVDVDWTLFSGFQVSNAIKASKHKHKSLEIANKLEEDQVVLKTIDLYDKLGLAIKSEEVIKSMTQYLEKQDKFVSSAINNGLATPIDRQKLSLAKQKLATKKLEAQNQQKLVIAVLQQYTGAAPEFLDNLRPDLLPFAIDETMESKKRNEINALEEAELATSFKSKMERNNFIPKIALKGHYEFIEDDLSLLEPKWYVGVGTKWNIFDGFVSKLKSDQTKIEGLKYREQINETEELIQLGITMAQLSLQSAKETSLMTQLEVDLAESNYELTNKQYKNGLTTVSEVLDALTEVEKAKFDLQKSYYNQRKAGIELLYAKGLLTF
ncbi:hypothetical protein KCTC52924_01415 [Arenibacter antarcticus]|uniref:TolC family protein n=1 Tax=Arenibacter antarcticus TaxID=2040469 RepID=A0ABW5V9Y0_9FLAO|nr:TolC family protein [Arenibacter sp. H213]MCM4167782.1 TolC family protein [Arenibacter sp. H213]